MGIIDNHLCLLYGIHEEISQHLFFDCVYSRICWNIIKNWLNWNLIDKLHNITRWIGRGKSSKFKQLVYSAMVVATVYQIWKIRNEVLWNDKLITPDRGIKQIKDIVKNRIRNINSTKYSLVDKCWYNNL
ncbi:unnamed protein product [Vicia faba]|uniref:Reverse transcriptase zinc-binding domain-containing protein n=1 Tax=Vicia faba TaxID=3906 RepID=A0AAV0Z9A3_VICFA|nr:unnamed protein product [Vicia faba]